MRRDKVYIIGIAPEGASSLSASTARIVKDADLVFGGERLLRMFPALKAERVTIKKDLAGVARRIDAELGKKRVVVLASGDPDFFGIARYLIGKLGKSRVEIVPNVSSMQLAFARIKESWDDAVLVSVHSRPIEDIVGIVRESRKIGIFTDDNHTPAEIARVLLDCGIENCCAYVCQDIGASQEKIVATRLRRLCDLNFSPLCTMILIRDVKGNSEGLLGIPETSFSRKKGLITKAEVRAVSLAQLGLNDKSIVWDIGAGSGAVSIEAAALVHRGRIFAIEKDSECIAYIRRNIKKFGKDNVTVVPIAAPESLKELPDPSAVFVGGSGGDMETILDCACGRLQPGGRIVINAATLENLQAAIAALKDHGFRVEITQVNISRSRDIIGLTRFEPLNPVFVVSARRITPR